MTQDKQSFEEILESYHVTLENNRRDESIKLAAEKYAKEQGSHDKPEITAHDYMQGIKSDAAKQYWHEQFRGESNPEQGLSERIGENSDITDDLFQQSESELQHPHSAGDNWISVDERLPEDKQRVVVVQNPETTATKYSLYAEYDAKNKRFINPSFSHDGIHLGVASWADIILWQPLPKPPIKKQ